MNGSPTLRALLGPLEPWLDDAEVREVIVAAPDRVLVRRVETDRIAETIAEPRLRAIAEKLVKVLTPFDTDRWRGAIGAGLGARVLGAPRGVAPPILHVYRVDPPTGDLSELLADDAGARAVLEEACADGCTIVVTGRRASGKTALVAALAREWKRRHKVALIEPPRGVLDAADVGHFRLDPAHGARDAIELGADVLVADDAAPKLLAALIELGRPFVASIEAQDGSSALARLIARAATGELESPRAAAELLVESTVGMIAETSDEPGQPRVRVLELAREKNTLVVRPMLTRRRTSSSPRAASTAPREPLAFPDQTPERGHVAEPPPPTRPVSVPPRVTSRAPRRATPLSMAVSRAAKSSEPPVELRDVDLTPALLAPPPGGSRDRSDDPDLTPARLVNPKKELGALVAIPTDAPPVELSGPHGFDSSELSEIRAEQLVSTSFVMSLNDIGATPDDGPYPDDSQEVVLLDVPPEAMDADDKTSDGTADLAAADPLADEDDSLVSPIGEPEVDSALGDLGDADIEDDELAAVSSLSRDPAEGMRRVRMELAEETIEPDDGPALTRTELEEKIEDAFEARQVRREAAERMPTVLNQQSAADNPLYRDAPPVSPSNRDSWAQAEYQRLAAATEAEEIDGIPDLGSGDLDLVTTSEPAPGGDLEAQDLLTGSAMAMVSEGGLDESDLDSTQSAQLGEMVSGVDVAPYDPAEQDFSTFATMNPDLDDPGEEPLADPELTGTDDPATGEHQPDELPVLRSELIRARSAGRRLPDIPQEPTRDLPVRANGKSDDEREQFDEDTPFSPLLDRDSLRPGAKRTEPEIIPATDLHQQIDPGRAAVVSGEEFDAMLDEIRDVTHAAAAFDSENTESANEARPPAKQGPKPGSGDAKKRPRLR